VDTQEFVQSVINGNAAEAQDILNAVLSNKAFESLQDRKIELAQNIFATTEQGNTETE
jgi:thymidine phosphorylase